MKFNSSITLLVLVTLVNAAPFNRHNNGGLPDQTGVNIGDSTYAAAAPNAVQPGYAQVGQVQTAVQPATIPQPPPAAAPVQPQAKTDLFSYLANVPVVGNVLAQSSPQALKSVQNAMPASIELPEVEDS